MILLDPPLRIAVALLRSGVPVFASPSGKDEAIWVRTPPRPRWDIALSLVGCRKEVVAMGYSRMMMGETETGVSSPKGRTESLRVAFSSATVVIWAC
jgi:hypothetical protein